MAEGNWLMSAPISAIKAATATALMLGTVCVMATASSTGGGVGDGYVQVIDRLIEDVDVR